MHTFTYINPEFTCMLQSCVPNTTVIDLRIPSPHTLSQEDDYLRCAKESSRIEDLYGHFFDATIVNENIDTAYEEMLATIRVFSTGKHWVPANWVM